MSEIIVSERVSNFEMPIVYSVIMHLIHKKHVLKIIIMLFVMLLDCMALQVTIKLDTRPTSGANLQEPSQNLPLMTHGFQSVLDFIFLDILYGTILITFPYSITCNDFKLTFI